MSSIMLQPRSAHTLSRVGLDSISERNLFHSGRIKLIKQLTRSSLLTLDIGSSISNLGQIRLDVDCSKYPDLIASALHIPLRSGALEQVVFTDVMEHLPAKSELSAVLEIFRVLRNEGNLIISTPNSMSLYRILDPTWFIFGHRHYSVQYVGKLLRKAGFEVNKVFSTGFIGSSIQFFLQCLLVYPLKLVLRRELPVWFMSQTVQREYSLNYLGSGLSVFACASKSK